MNHNLSSHIDAVYGAVSPPMPEGVQYGDHAPLHYLGYEIGNDNGVQPPEENVCRYVDKRYQVGSGMVIHIATGNEQGCFLKAHVTQRSCNAPTRLTAFGLTLSPDTLHWIPPDANIQLLTVGGTYAVHLKGVLLIHPSTQAEVAVFPDQHMTSSRYENLSQQVFSTAVWKALTSQNERRAGREACDAQHRILILPSHGAWKEDPVEALGAELVNRLAALGCAPTVLSVDPFRTNRHPHLSAGVNGNLSVVTVRPFANPLFGLAQGERPIPTLLTAMHRPRSPAEVKVSFKNLTVELRSHMKVNDQFLRPIYNKLATPWAPTDSPGVTRKLDEFQLPNDDPTSESAGQLGWPLGPSSARLLLPSASPVLYLLNAPLASDWTDTALAEVVADICEESKIDLVIVAGTQPSAFQQTVGARIGKGGAACISCVVEHRAEPPRGRVELDAGVASYRLRLIAHLYGRGPLYEMRRQEVHLRSVCPVGQLGGQGKGQGKGQGRALKDSEIQLWMESVPFTAWNGISYPLPATIFAPSISRSCHLLPTTGAAIVVEIEMGKSTTPPQDEEVEGLTTQQISEYCEQMTVLRESMSQKRAVLIHDGNLQEWTVETAMNLANSVGFVAVPFDGEKDWQLPTPGPVYVTDVNIFGKSTLRNITEESDGALQRFLLRREGCLLLELRCTTDRATLETFMETPDAVVMFSSQQTVPFKWFPDTEVFIQEEDREEDVIYL